MQSLRFTTKLTYLLLVAAFILSCKKDDKFQDPGQKTLVEQPIDPTHPIYEDWELITSAFYNVEQITASNNNVYFFSRNFNTYNLVELNAQNNTTVKYSFTPTAFSITDMCFFNNALYYSGSGYPQLSKYDLTTSQNTAFASVGSGVGINALHVFQGKLLITGNFQSGSWISTQYVDCLNSSDMTLGIYPSNNFYNGFYSEGNNLYAFQAGLSGLKKWNGSQWASVVAGLDQRTESVVRLHDTTYIAGSSQAWNYDVYVARTIMPDGSIDYITNFNVPSVSQGGVLKFCVLNNVVYAYGYGLSQDYVHTNVFKQVGGKWVHDAVIHEKVNDLEYFNGHLYAATNSGVYRH